VSLGFAQGSSLPIRHLLNLAYAFTENRLCNFCKPSLLLDQVNFTEVGLRINEVGNVLDELQMRMLAGELFDVRVEAKADNN